MSAPGARVRRIIPRVAAAVAATTTLACGGGSQARAPDTVYLEADDASESVRLMPLDEGLVYQYETHTEGSPEVGVMTIEVRDARRGQVTLHFAGHTEHLRSARDGIAIAEGGYLLKSPIEVGATWEGALGTVRVLSVTDSIQVPAGKFTDCVRTVEQERVFGGVKTVTSVYCPHVGLASIDIRSKTEHETALLRSHAPRIDPLIGVTPTKSE